MYRIDNISVSYEAHQTLSWLLFIFTPKIRVSVEPYTLPLTSFIPGDTYAVPVISIFFLGLRPLF